jgi:hypothetical protein
MTTEQGSPPYRLIAEPRDGYVHVRVTGSNTREVVAAYLGEIRELSGRNKWTAVLIEEHLAGPGLDMLDVFAIVNTESARTGSGLRRIAIVDTNPEHDHAMMKFAETAAFNRGINARVFRTVAAAERWLGSAEGSDGHHGSEGVA